MWSSLCFVRWWTAVCGADICIAGLRTVGLLWLLFPSKVQSCGWQDWPQQLTNEIWSWHNSKRCQIWIWGVPQKVSLQVSTKVDNITSTSSSGGQLLNDSNCKTPQYPIDKLVCIHTMEKALDQYHGIQLKALTLDTLHYHRRAARQANIYLHCNAPQQTQWRHGMHDANLRQGSGGALSQGRPQQPQEQTCWEPHLWSHTQDTRVP